MSDCDFQSPTCGTKTIDPRLTDLYRASRIQRRRFRDAPDAAGCRIYLGGRPSDKSPVPSEGFARLVAIYWERTPNPRIEAAGRWMTRPISSELWHDGIARRGRECMTAMWGPFSGWFIISWDGIARLRRM